MNARPSRWLVDDDLLRSIVETGKTGGAMPGDLLPSLEKPLLAHQRGEAELVGMSHGQALNLLLLEDALRVLRGEIKPGSRSAR